MSTLSSGWRASTTTRPAVFDAAVAVNDGQSTCLIGLLDPKDVRFAVLDLWFNPKTDDVRNSRPLGVITQLQERGADVVAYGSAVMDVVRERLPEQM
jgi:UDPglucose 6-dehydrogenase